MTGRPVFLDGDRPFAQRWRPDPAGQGLPPINLQPQAKTISRCHECCDYFGTSPEAIWHRAAGRLVFLRLGEFGLLDDGRLGFSWVLPDVGDQGSGIDASGFVYPLGIPIRADAFFPYMVSLSVLLQRVFVLPVMGAVVDYTHLKKRLMGIFACIGAFSARSLFSTAPITRSAARSLSLPT